MKREDIKRSYEVICRLEQIDKDIDNINVDDKVNIYLGQYHGYYHEQYHG